MSMLSIDGTLVIFEGVHRLRWVTVDWFGQLPTADGPGTPQRILSHIWPDRESGARIRRLIDQRQRVVIVIESRKPVITLARNQVPRTPVGAVELDVSDSAACRLTIPPFTWLSERHRRRGEEFIAHSTQFVTDPCGETIPSVQVEDSLIGRSEPVRFVYGQAPLTFGMLRTAIGMLYDGGTVATLTVCPARSHRQSPTVSLEQQRAA